MVYDLCMEKFQYVPPASAETDILGVEPGDWRIKGSCSGEDPELFFYPDGEKGAARAKRAEAAKKVCKTCPVINTCLEWSIQTGEQYGVWGGLSEEERTRLVEASA